MDDRMLSLALRFQKANNDNDAALMAEVCDPAMVVWHNYDRLETVGEANTKSLGWMHKTVKGIEWVTKSLLTTPEGFVWRHNVTGEAPGGLLNIESCIVATVDSNMRITRIEEYLDPVQAAVLRG